MQMKSKTNIDVVWGAATIGEVLGINARQAHYKLTTGALKSTGAKLVGGRWCASRKQLLAFVEMPA